MFSYDQDTRRQFTAERFEQYKQDAASSPSTRRRSRRRRMQIMRRAFIPFMSSIRRAPKASASA
jgi:hypothetical protein